MGVHDQRRGVVHESFFVLRSRTGMAQNKMGKNYGASEL